MCVIEMEGEEEGERGGGEDGGRGGGGWLKVNITASTS